MMKSVEITLPEPLANFAPQQTETKGFNDVNEYVLALLRKDWHASQQEELEAKLIEGIECLERGDAKPMLPEDCERLRQQIRDKYNVPPCQPT